MCRILVRRSVELDRDNLFALVVLAANHADGAGVRLLEDVARHVAAHVGDYFLEFIAAPNGT